MRALRGRVARADPPDPLGGGSRDACPPPAILASAGGGLRSGMARLSGFRAPPGREPEDSWMLPRHSRWVEMGYPAVCTAASPRRARNQSDAGVRGAQRIRAPSAARRRGAISRGLLVGGEREDPDDRAIRAERLSHRGPRRRICRWRSFHGTSEIGGDAAESATGDRSYGFSGLVEFAGEEDEPGTLAESTERLERTLVGHVRKPRHVPAHVMLENVTNQIVERA